MPIFLIPIWTRTVSSLEDFSQKSCMRPQSMAKDKNLKSNIGSQEKTVVKMQDILDFVELELCTELIIKLLGKNKRIEMIHSTW